MPARLYGIGTLLSFRVYAVYALASVMFVIKQWGKRFATMSAASSQQQQQQQRPSRQVQAKRSEPRPEVNLAYQPEEEIGKVAGVQRLESTRSTELTIRHNPNKHEVEKRSVEKRCEQRCSSCRCQNCRSLQSLTECGVCLESLQSTQIKACPVCANVVCTNCASRLTSCAYCRSRLPAERNRALERLIDRILLPCRNSRSGCKVLLNGESRFIHESICNYSSITCPVGRGVCGWHGTVASVQSHLQSTHNLQPLRDYGISVEIHSFRSKAAAVDGRVYTVCLACYEQLFVIRVVLFQSRLRLCFTRLGYEESQPSVSSTRPRRYGVSVGVRAAAGCRLRGLVPFGKYDRECRELTLTLDKLYPRQRQPEPSQSCKDDIVKIDLLVKQLDEQQP